MRAAPTSSLDRAVALQSIKHELNTDAVASVIHQVMGRFSPPARALLFGGVLRNAVLSAVLHKTFPIRDLDFVVFGLASDDELHETFARDRAGPNSFGGLKAVMSGFAVDIWRAELEMQIAGQPPRVTTVDEFLECVTLTTDAVLYDPQSDSVHEREFLDAIGHRTIDLGVGSHWIDPWVPYHLAHLAYVRHLTGFALSDDVRIRVRRLATVPIVEQAIQYLQLKDLPIDPPAVVQSLLSDVQA